MMTHAQPVTVTTRAHANSTTPTRLAPYPRIPAAILYLLLYTMGPGPGLVAHVLWRYCMRLASSGVGGVRRVRLALLYVGRGVWGGCIGHRVPSEG